jgi:DeoR family transcriptional regulator, suf operon transcriptional repressor
MPTEIPTISESQRQVLYALKRRGDATTEELAESLGITISGARQHLLALMSDGLVGAREVPRLPNARGRPQHRYAPTSAAENVFPKAYGELTNELLGYLEDDESELLQRMFTKRRDARVMNARARLATKKTLAAQVAELTKILDEDGYLASFEKLVTVRDGKSGFLIIEHNCAIFAVASQYGQACSSELDFLRTVLPNTTVDRVSHMVAGARQCAYEILPNKHS